MHVDFLTLACLRDDLDALVGGRAQRVVLPDDLSVGIELYAREVGRRFLLLSAHPQSARALLTEEKLRRGVEKESPLLLLLRKYVRGGHLVGVFQPPWERVLDLHFEGAEGPIRLLAEIMGRHSNVVLVGLDGRVLEAVKRIGPEINRYRVTLPGKPYVPPPPQANKRIPTALDAAGWRGLLTGAAQEAPLATLLLHTLAGTSPTMARELATRAAGQAEALAAQATPDALVAAVAGLFAPLEEGGWTPSVALDPDGTVTAFAPYWLTQFASDGATVEPVATISAGMARFFAARLSGDAYAAARRRVGDLLEDARARAGAILHQLAQQTVTPDEVERLREAGELLLAYQWQVARGAGEVTVPDAEGQPQTISLDPTLSPVENAQAYFRRYEKAKHAAEEVPARRDEVEAQMAYLDQLATDLALAETRPEIEAVRAALVEAGYVRAPRPKAGGAVRGPLQLEVEGFAILVGRNARQNEAVTFERAAGDDLWLHARGVPGAHVIVKRAGHELPPAVVQRAAELAAYYSQARGSTEVAVDVTERRYVTRMRAAGPGIVHYREERTLHVSPRAPDEE